MKFFILLSLSFLVLFSCSQIPDKPNVIVILTDDQGYGDLGIHGNEIIQTPNMDEIARQGVRFDDFHVGTTCAPTRAGLMTGRYCNRVGVWHTIMGRHFLRENEVTMPEIFQSAGYRTGMFGKWHLGDNYPYRPHDRGFETAFYHGGGGVWQLPDYWNNDYFDYTYYHNGVPEKTTGYCTDVWFDKAIEFIENNHDEPFLCYLATNAPHGPFHVPQAYLDIYKENPDIPNPNFYGMITNIDDNLAELDAVLNELKIRENTILVFMTDNGTSAGVQLDKNGLAKRGFNAGMRGMKGHCYDGGHRVPFFIRWPGHVQPNTQIDEVTAYIDVLPTLLEMCDIAIPDSLDLDGKSLVPLLTGSDEWPERTLFTDTQRIEQPQQWKDSAVMTNQWRLIRGNVLYDIQQDPGQQHNIAQDYPEVVAELRQAYEEWWQDTGTLFDETSPVVVGTRFENPTVFTSHDLHPETDGYPAWNQTDCRLAKGQNGYWVVDFRRSGKYAIRLRRWPQAANAALNASVPQTKAVPGGQPFPKGVALDVARARLTLGDSVREKNVDGNADYVEFQTTVDADVYKFKAELIETNQTEHSAYVVEVEFID